MPLIVTAGQLSRRANLYHQIGSTLAAGLPLMQSLELLGKSSEFRADHHALGILLQQLTSGSTFAEALATTGNWSPEFDTALLAAGERSGRLDTAFRQLSEYYGERARLVRGIMADLAYPLFLVHMAILIFPPELLTHLVWQGQVAAFVFAKLMALLPIYGFVFIALFALQGRRGETWRHWIERLIYPVPLLGTAMRNLALARLAAALEGLINAGVSIIEGWELAARAAGSPALRRVVAGWRPLLEAGETPSELVRASGAFPEIFASLYYTGEVSGRLDESLKRISRLYMEEGTRQLRAVAQWTPRLIYFAVALAIAYHIVSFWTNYYGKMLEAF